MTDRASAEGLPQTQAGTFLRNGLEAMGYDEQSANDAIVAIEREAAALRDHSDSGDTPDRADQPHYDGAPHCAGTSRFGPDHARLCIRYSKHDSRALATPDRADPCPACKHPRHPELCPECPCDTLSPDATPDRADRKPVFGDADWYPPAPDRAEHDRQSASGEHLFDENCPMCVAADLRAALADIIDGRIPASPKVRRIAGEARSALLPTPGQG